MSDLDKPKPKKGVEMPSPTQRTDDKQESVGVPVDMTPDPKFSPLHQGEKLDTAGILEALKGNRIAHPSLEEAGDRKHVEDSEKP